MPHKAALRINRKLLKDAKEYLELSRQLIIIRKAMLDEPDQLSQSKVDFIESLAPILQTVDEVVPVVIDTTTALSSLPSGTPSHKRRQCANALKDVLADKAEHIHAIFHAILTAGALYEDNVAEEEPKDDAE